MTNDKIKMTNGKWLSLIVCCLFVIVLLAPATRAQSTQTQATTPDFQSIIARQAALVSEFDVNGLKVLVKRREGSQTVVAGLFLRGGSRNVTAEDAGVEALMLDVASEATQNFPREQLRRELARTGTNLSYGINNDYSALTLGSTRRYFDRSWEIFADSALHPSFLPEDFQRGKNRVLVSLSE